MADRVVRTHQQRSGAAFAGAYYESYAYNDRSELTGSEYYTGTYGSGTPVATADRDWGYDNIGNRDTFMLGAGTGSESETAYTANDLNQYDQTYREGTGAPSVQKSSFDEDGNLTQAYLVGDVSGDGTLNNFDLSPFTYALTHSEGEFDTQYPSGCYWCADLNGDGTVNNFDTSPFMGLLSTGGTA
ncbi:MAG: hypothetical protein PVJ57_23165, partial [Phycisphaerae bacterium]